MSRLSKYTKLVLGLTIGQFALYFLNPQRWTWVYLLLNVGMLAIMLYGDLKEVVSGG